MPALELPIIKLAFFNNVKKYSNKLLLVSSFVSSILIHFLGIFFRSIESINENSLALYILTPFFLAKLFKR